MEKYKVYARVDGAGRILAVQSSAFLPDATGWVEIDEGLGDRYHHAQNHYLGRIMTDEGVPLYKLVDGAIMRRTQAEVDAETVEEDPRPTMEERMTEMEEALEMLLSGVTE